MKVTKKKITIKKKFILKGIVDAGTVYGVILLSILVGGGLLLIGNISPKVASPDENQSVIIQRGDDSNRKNLQLEDFPGVTLTPTPSPTPTPTPTPTQPPPSTGGGGGNGGNNKSSGGGGGGSGNSGGGTL